MTRNQSGVHQRDAHGSPQPAEIPDLGLEGLTWPRPHAFHNQSAHAEFIMGSKSWVPFVCAECGSHRAAGAVISALPPRRRNSHFSVVPVTEGAHVSMCLSTGPPPRGGRPLDSGVLTARQSPRHSACPTKLRTLYSLEAMTLKKQLRRSL